MVGVGRSCRGSGAGEIGWHRAACVSPAVISLLGVLLLLHTQYQEVTTLFGTLSDGAKRHPPLARAWLADDVAIALAPAGGLHCVAKTKGLVQCTGTFEATIEGDAVQLAGGRVHLEDHPDVKSSRERASNAGALLGPSEDFRVVPWRPETPKTKRSSGLTKQGNATSTNSDIVMFGLRLKQKMAGNVLMTSSLSGPNHFADATLLNRGAAKTEVNTSKVQEKASTWRNNPEDRLHQRQVVVVAGVEGTGHHMFHDMFWPSLAKFVSGVAHDRGFHLHFTGRDQPQFEGLAGLQHHFAYRNRPTFAGYTPAYKAMVNAERLINLSISLPNVSLLLTDEPSFPALPLELSTNGGFETMPFHCPDLLALAAGAAAANWTLRVVVLVRNWPDVLHSGVTREASNVYDGAERTGEQLDCAMGAFGLRCNGFCALNLRTCPCTFPWLAGQACTESGGRREAPQIERECQVELECPEVDRGDFHWQRSFGTVANDRAGLETQDLVLTTHLQTWAWLPHPIWIQTRTSVAISSSAPSVSASFPWSRPSPSSLQLSGFGLPPQGSH